ncbi:hypothetical protein [Roseovarius sp. D22-M7]|uniref:hypothetical protein n=1 Tax=Roseovarius sp. D22-M7 TaxID=3127116 RepID=UPI00300FC1C4
MRKKIPTITRPDPTYSAALRQDGRDFQERKEEEPAPVIAKLTTVAEPEMRPFETELETAQAPKALDAESTGIGPATNPVASARRKTPTRKIDIRVNALERQETALQACGVEPAQVVRAALRRAVKDWQLAPIFAFPSAERRTRNAAWQARTSLAVDAASLGTLLRDHDPLDVLSKWALTRGQIEPRIWAEIDALLAEIADRAASQYDP